MSAMASTIAYSRLRSLRRCSRRTDDGLSARPRELPEWKGVVRGTGNIGTTLLGDARSRSKFYHPRQSGVGRCLPVAASGLVRQFIA